jgi:type IV pilus assembly protein PilQ
MGASGGKSLRGPTLILGLACLAALGCGGRGARITADVEALAAPTSALTQLEDAFDRYERKDFLGASQLLRETLQTHDSFRVMPDLLHLLGYSTIALGDSVQAAACFDLLRRYYPQAWARLSDLNYVNAILTNHSRALEANVGAGEWQVVQMGEAAPGEAVAALGNPGHAPATESRVSNVFYDADIFQVLADLSLQTGVPIIASSSTRGRVTLELADLPLEECLDRITAPLGLSYAWTGSYYLVGDTSTEDATSLALTQTEEIRPVYLLAKEVPKLLPDYYRRYLRVDGITGNTLTVSGPPHILERFKRDLAAIDRRPQQVMLEAFVIEVSRDQSRNWGVDWEILGGSGSGAFKIAKLVPALLDSAFSANWTDKNVTGLGKVTDVSVNLRAMERRGAARIRANPQIATADGRQAKIRVGSEAYYSLLSGSVTYSYYTLQKIATGITLTITPYVSAGAEVTADIAVEVSDVSAAGANGLPVTSVREVETRAQLGNGESVLIGGLLSEAVRDTQNRIPFLGRIPLLGALFGYTGEERGKTEVLILVTPHILIQPGELSKLL